MLGIISLHRYIFEVRCRSSHEGKTNKPKKKERKRRRKACFLVTATFLKLNFIGARSVLSLASYSSIVSNRHRAPLLGFSPRSYAPAQTGNTTPDRVPAVNNLWTRDSRHFRNLGGSIAFLSTTPRNVFTCACEFIYRWAPPRVS